MKQVEELLLFEFFYSFKTLWKRYHDNKIDVLYKMLSAKKAGNKSMFDDILADKQSSIAKNAEDLSKIIGIQRLYVIGVDEIEPISSISGWGEFAALHKKGQSRNKEETLKYRELRKSIEDKLYDLAGKDEVLKKSEAFSRFVYFCKYGQRRDETNIATIFNSVTEGMSAITKENIKKAKPEDLLKFKNSLITMVHRIEALEEIEKWK